MQFDLNKEHPAARVRIPSADEVVFHLVGDRSPIGLEVPDLLRSTTLRLVRTLPKSGLQIVGPTSYQISHRERAAVQPVRFGVIFSDSFQASAADILSEPALLQILLWETRSQGAIEALAQMSGPFVIFPASAEHRQALQTGGVPTERLATSAAEILARIELKTRLELGLTADEMGQRKAAARTIAEEFLAALYPRKVLPFSPVRVNVEQLSQLFGQFDPDFWKEEPNNFTKRTTALAESFDAVRDAVGSIAAAAGVKGYSAFPSAVFAFPSISPHLRRHMADFAKNLPPKFRAIGRSILELRIAEQDSATYVNHVDIQDEYLRIAVELGLRELAAYSHFFDFVGYLHASFENSPYLRAPVKGASLASEQSFFSPANFATNAVDKSICKRVYRFGSSLARALDVKLRASLMRYPGGLVGLSDLPLEWMDLDGVPLGFLSDFCRIPETGITNLLAQFNRNRQSSFQITETTPVRTLVVCGAPEGDPISKAFDGVSEIQRRHAGEHMWQLERCSSIDSFCGLVNEFRPELLVIDSHGRFVANESGTEIQLGFEMLNGNHVIERLPQIPLVVLSACWGAPLYGCANTIAHAFFEAGSYSVTTSLLPLDVSKGNLLYTRLLCNLKYAASHAVHSSWASFVSHNIRTSYFDDLLSRASARYGLEPEESARAFGEQRLNWKVQTMFPNRRAAAYHETRKIVASCFGAKKVGRVRSILEAKSYLPEFLFYTTLGRADLVKFAIWNETNKREGDKVLSVADLLKGMDAAAHGASG